MYTMSESIDDASLFPKELDNYCIDWKDLFEEKKLNFLLNILSIYQDISILFRYFLNLKWQVSQIPGSYAYHF